MSGGSSKTLRGRYPSPVSHSASPALICATSIVSASILSVFPVPVAVAAVADGADAFAFAIFIATTIGHTPQKAENPPSTGTTIPFTKAAASEISHIIVPIKSCGTPKRPIGVCSITETPRGVRLPVSCSVNKKRFCSVIKKPGAIAFTRILGE